ncbi:MAG: hypothetical protein IPL53_25365 [Ignavibacteria bacterium]|nr:hypothetical protein [Ignavibacteria bacterium]
MDILSKIKRYSNINNSAIDLQDCYTLFKSLTRNVNQAVSGKEKKISNKNITGKFLFYYDEDGIRIAIGGKEKNIYTGHFDFIIDLGGDDVYNIDNNFSCIIDLSGNDYYTTNSNYSLAGAVFSSGFIFDKEGDDTYKGKNVSSVRRYADLGFCMMRTVTILIRQINSQ